jgi:Fur family ferric uptake transcriptional regulator
VALLPCPGVTGHPSKPAPGLDAYDLTAGLRRAGLRVTAACRAVCATLAAAGGERLTAGGVAAGAVAARTGAGVDLATGDRTLDAPEGWGMVEHVHLGHGPGACHVGPSAQHHHLVSDACGRTVDKPISDLRRALERVTVPHGSMADSAHFAILGRCSPCAAGD